METNLSRFDQGIRIVAGMTTIGAVIVNPFIPAWLALAAAYAVLTSISCWDPIYAAMHKLFGVRSTAQAHADFRLSQSLR